ncbi:type III-B CRISPR module RAMP protein Cmr4 [Sorangium sp. So ce1014]|uniref:type III-B CRISPR module RAMP protein Cmr4 n=1 Tax=Sorangium sp. So ce1014 TaxID=3133326 RepID=UPI003F61AD37
MSESINLLLIHALSPVHCGTGESVGGIDLPIAREKPTGIPLIPGSTLKGVLRSAASADAGLHRAVFGPDTANASEHAGSVQIADATLLFLPVRSARGTFAWVTSPYVLRRFGRDAREAGRVDLAPPAIAPDEGQAIVTGGALRLDDLGGKVVFEDYDLQSTVSEELERFAGALATVIWGAGDVAAEDRSHFVARVCVVHDDVMSLLLQTCLEITTRVRLDADKKTVVKGALWTEEALPVETILAGLVLATPVKQPKPVREGGADRYEAKELLGHVQGLAGGGMVQLGGKATVGRGLCRMTMVG